jgi:hypothetical protein
MCANIVWPPLPVLSPSDPQADFKKILYQAQIDVIKNEYQAQLAIDKAKIDADIESDKRNSNANLEREKADWASEYVQAQAVNSAYLDAAKSSLDRSVTRADFVQKAAAAISGAYVSMLGLIYAVASNKLLPDRGIIPTLFLGLAIFLASAYVSFITKPSPVSVLASDGTLPDIQRQRRNSFVLWIRDEVLRRRQFLQAAVISLGIGVLSLPLPFLDVQDTTAIFFLFGGLCGVLFLPSMISNVLGENPLSV